VNLTECEAHAPATVVGLDLPGMAGFRLRELGLRPGAVVTVTHDAGPMGRVVAIGADRFALDLPTCAAVLVQVAR
jgi:ferrous iron transport protein A